MKLANDPHLSREGSLWQTAVALFRAYLSGRRGLIALSVLTVGAAVTFNWGWLVAVGVAPLLVALAPCAAMCAAGLCMHKMGRSTNPAQLDSRTQLEGGVAPSSASAVADVSEQAPIVPTTSETQISIQQRNWQSHEP